MTRVHGKLALKSGASIAALAISLAASGGVCAGGLPSGGHFVSGQGVIDKAGRSLTVKQSSTTGIIDWQGFSVGHGSAATFDNGSGATLNRVTGGNLSRIAGSLHATGSLYLIDAQGVIVSGTGRIVTGGSFMASGSEQSGAFDFDGRKRATAAIVNRGQIASGGTVNLTGSRVENSGRIDAAAVTLRADKGDARDSGTIHAVGNAGRDAHILIVAENGKTKITGELLARNRDGSGGTIETSGRKIAIGGTIDAGRGGTWLVDPRNLTVTESAATTIDKSLNKGASVTLKTRKSSTSGPGTSSSGPGDIVIDSALSWHGAATLTLDAYHGVTVDAAVADSGKGGLTILTDDGGKKGTLAFGSGDDITFAKLTDALTINGTLYTLVGDLATLESDAAANSSGDFALAGNYNAKSDGTYGASVVMPTFTGIFEGLGNSISNLTIHDTKDRYVGLFSEIGFGGEVRDISLTSLKVTGTDEFAETGGLAGENDGTIVQSSVAGSVTGGYEGDIGGLTGENFGTISDAKASGEVSVNQSSNFATVGGLVGANEPESSITDSSASSKVTGGTGSTGGLVGVNFGGGILLDDFATGAVKNGTAGGLAGDSNGEITASYATGSVDGGADAGGLVGENESSGKISKSYATGDTTTGADGFFAVGGLVGRNLGGIGTSYAKGTVNAATGGGSVTGALNSFLGGLAGTNSGAITGSYAVGAVSGDVADLGGLAGSSNGSIANSFATGAVDGGKNGKVGDEPQNIGGLVGANFLKISDSYSTGAVTAAKHAQIGGLIGEDDSTSGDIVDAYWDKTTAKAAHGVGNISNDHGVTGKTTAQLQTKLPFGFKASIWSINADVNGGLPYLKALASSF